MSMNKILHEMAEMVSIVMGLLGLVMLCTLSMAITITYKTPGLGGGLALVAMSSFVYWVANRCQ